MMRIVALAGGVGGAKLADGLEGVVGESLTVIVNTGDDLHLYGLHICPDLDTVVYTLAGIGNPDTGWGLQWDTFNALGMLSNYGEHTWFQLGDRDLATHILRTRMLNEGEKLSDVTRRISAQLGVRASVLPMSDQAVATRLITDEGELDFQDYFVRRRWQPAIESIRFDGIEKASPSPGSVEALQEADLIAICPSNPFVSIEPILSVRGLGDAIRAAPAKKIAVSPIVGGEALKGPAAKMFREFGKEPTVHAVAEKYVGLIDGFVVDEQDRAHCAEVASLGMEVLVTNTVMRTESDRETLARGIIEWSTGIRGQ